MTTEVIVHYQALHGFGGATVIATHDPGDSFYTVRTAICSKQDQYCKREGVRQAREWAGIRIPCPSSWKKGTEIRLPRLSSWKKGSVSHIELRLEVLERFPAHVMTSHVPIDKKSCKNYL